MLILFVVFGFHGMGQVSYAVEFTYDAAGNRTKIIVVNVLEPGGKLVTEGSNADSSDEESVISDENGIIDNVANQQITIYPNPTKGVVYYRSTIPIDEEGTVVISDANGRIIENTPLKTKGTLDFTGFVSGLYFVSVTLKGDTSFWKIIKE